MANEQSKSGFIKQVLFENPFANVKTVNEAWQNAGMAGSISPALVNKMRSEAGLTGNLRDRGKAEAQAAAETEKPKKRGRKRKVKPRAQGKTQFVREFLTAHPEGNVKAVNEAWQTAGNDGTISHTLVSQMRAKLKLTGNRRGKAAKTEAASRTEPAPGKKRGRKPKGTSPATTGSRRSAQTSGLLELESDIDRLLFRVMGVGDLPEIEDSLRRTRRILYGRLDQG
jgi:hypothetical protein